MEKRNLELCDQNNISQKFIGTPNEITTKGGTSTKFLSHESSRNS